MPDELADIMKNDNPFYAIQYEGEQHKAQEIIKANGIMATLEAAVSLSNFENTIGFAVKGYENLMTIARANGAPSENFENEKDYNDAVAAYKKSQQAAAAAEMAAINPQAADAAGQTADRLSNQLAQMRY